MVSRPVVKPVCFVVFMFMFFLPSTNVLLSVIFFSVSFLFPINIMIRSWTPTGLARDPLLTVFDHDTQVNCVQLYDSLVLSGGENGTIALHDSRQGDAAIMLCDVDDPITSMKWVKILHLSAMACSV